MDNPVVIVGAGPAGLSCARTLLSRGVPVTLLDDNLQAGGQYFRQLPPGYTAAADARLLRETGRARELLAVLREDLLTCLPGTTVWSIPAPGMVAYAGPNGTGRIRARAIVLATGAQEVPFPFPGWVLPGVISAGGCLNLAKGQGLVPAGKVVVAGNGPLVLVAAATLAAAGAKVTHVIEAQPTRHVAAAMIRGLCEAPALVRKGVGYRMTLLRHGVRFLSGHVVTRAHGSGRIEAVDMAPLDPALRPHKTTRLEAQTLVLGYGLAPGSECARQSGCRMVRDTAMGGWVPQRSAGMETTVPGLYAIGDGAGIGGVEIALLEGQLAAHAILGEQDEPLQKRYRRIDGFRRRLSRAYQTHVPLSAADDETIICRCEDLRLKQLKAACLEDDTDLARVKSATRLGMGRCQGRNCLHSAARLLHVDATDRCAFPRTRPPVRPVRLRDLARDTSISPSREPDEALPASFE